jgi:O-antigen/teichoic acid export membrane protein
MPGQKHHWIAALKAFLVGQSLLQILNAVTGLLLVRWMSVEVYAQYTLANAFQVGAQQFVEFGLGGALVALVGKNINDKRRMGRLVVAGMELRSRMMWIVGSISAIAFPLWFVSKGWPVTTGLVLTISILGYLAVSGLQVYYRAPLTIHREMGTIYRISVVSAVARLAAISLAHAAQAISAPLAAFLNVAFLWLSGARLKKASACHLEKPKDSVEAERCELLDYIRPIIPGVVFAALQGQLAVMVAGVFGQTSTIAEVGALTRLSLLLGFFGAANGMIIAPFIARQHSRQLSARYTLIAAGALAMAAVLFAGAWLAPGIFLAILGPNYTDAGSALSFMVGNTCLGYINGVLWAMNSARKWVFGWMPMVSIPGTLALQALGIWLFDVSTATGVFQMLLLGTAYALLNRLLVAAYGFRIEAAATRGNIL